MIFETGFSNIEMEFLYNSTRRRRRRRRRVKREKNIYTYIPIYKYK